MLTGEGGGGLQSSGQVPFPASCQERKTLFFLGAPLFHFALAALNLTQLESCLGSNGNQHTGNVFLKGRSWVLSVHGTKESASPHSPPGSWEASPIPSSCWRVWEGKLLESAEEKTLVSHFAWDVCELSLLCWGLWVPTSAVTKGALQQG